MEKPKRKPIKRHPDLQPVSREHHYGLLLSFKIREGLKRGVEVARIKKYVDWFWSSHLKPHFTFEEEYVFPILGTGNILVNQALKEHGRIKQLISEEDEIEKNLTFLEQAVVAHIRFEERVLFMELEKIATPEQLARIADMHELLPSEVWEDKFWARK